MRIHLPQSLFLVSALMALSHASMASADEVAEFQNAQTAAHAWLLDVDQGDYPKSWQEAAEPFKKAVTPAQWQSTLNEVRAPFGKVVSRQPISAKYTRSLPDAMTGEYVVIQYQTRFANRTAVETVTPMREADGVWRVSGYFVQDQAHTNKPKP